MFKLRKALTLTAALGLLTLALPGCASVPEEVVTKPTGNYIGIVEVHGEIGPATEDSFSLSSSTYDHAGLMSFVDEMMEDSNNKAILLSLDTPGGTVYESDELYLKLMEYKEETGRPIYAYMHSTAASGGYYIAMAADEIYANRNTITGSIGVIMAGMDLSALYEKIGVKEINIASGANKAMGSAGTPMTDEQIAIFQAYVDESYDQFVDVVVEGRDMDEATVREIADGRIYTAKQALELGLIDGISLSEDYKEKILAEFENAEFYVPEEITEDFMTMLFGKINALIPKSDAQIMQDFCESNANVELKYIYGN